MSKGSSAISLKSVREAKKQLTNFIRTIDTVPTEILEEETSKLYEEIIREVPYESGKLERSVRVKVSRDKRRPGINASASAVSSRGYNYAGIQHEESSYKHSKTTAKYHYISDPFSRCTKRIRKKLRRRLRIK